MGGDAKGNQYRSKDGAGDPERCGPAEIGLRPVWQDRQYPAARRARPDRAAPEYDGVYSEKGYPQGTIRGANARGDRITRSGAVAVSTRHSRGGSSSSP